MSRQEKVNRGQLARLIRAHRVIAVGSRRFDDGYGESRGSADPKPVIFKPENKYAVDEYGISRLVSYGDGQRDVYFYIDEHDLKTSVGTAWKNEDGTVTVIVHGNLSYEFRVLDKSWTVGPPSQPPPSRQLERERDARSAERARVKREPCLYCGAPATIKTYVPETGFAYFCAKHGGG